MLADRDQFHAILPHSRDPNYSIFDVAELLYPQPPLPQRVMVRVKVTARVRVTDRVRVRVTARVMVTAKVRVTEQGQC